MASPRPNSTVASTDERIGDLERALERSEQRYRVLAENTPVGIWQITQPGRTVYMNSAMASLLQIDGPELGEETYHRFFTDESLEVMEVEHRKRSEGIASAYEVELVGARGRRRNVVIAGAPILDEDGTVQSVIGTFTDITERNQAEAALRAARDALEERVEERTAELRASERRWRSLAEHSPDFIILLSPEGRVDYANRVLPHQEYDQVLGSCVFDYVAPEVKEHLQALLADVVASRQGRTFEAPAEGVGGGTAWYVCRIAPIEAEGGALSVLLICTDITERKAAEEALRGSEARFRSLVEGSPDFIMSVDRDARITFINRIYPEFEMGDVIGSHVSEYMPPESNELVAAAMERVWKTGEIETLEVRATGPEGGIAWYIDRIGPILRGGEVVAITITATDVTERRRAEEELRASEARYRALAEHLPGVVTYVTRKPGTSASYMSPQVRELIGYTPEEWSTDPDRFVNAIHPKDRRRVLAEMEKQLRDGDIFSLEYRVIHRDGRVRWFHDHGVQLRDAAGAPTLYQGVMVDITAEKDAERALRRSQARHAAVVDAIPDMLFRVSREGVYLDFKPSRESEPLLPPEEFVGRHLDEVLPPEVAEQSRRSIEAAFETRETQDFEYELPGAGGGMQSWEARIVVSGEDEVIVMVRDITDRLHLERTILETSEREQSRIASDLHDGLGQELTGIAFMSKVLHRKLTERGADEADDAANIAEIVNQAITTTRGLARGLHPVEAEPHGLPSALEELAGTTRKLFDVDCRVEGAAAVELDDHDAANHLYRIAQEAVTNAVKHGKAQKIRIGLRVNPDERVVLDVRDDGVGFPTEVRSPGMGLRIMNHRARMIGASFEITAGSDGGTVVRCTFRDDGAAL